MVDLQKPEKKKIFGTIQSGYNGKLAVSSDGTKVYRYSDTQVVMAAAILSRRLTVYDLNKAEIETHDLIVPNDLGKTDVPSFAFNTTNISPDLRWMAYQFGLFNISSMIHKDIDSLNNYEVSNFFAPWSIDGRYIYFQARKDRKPAVGLIFDTTNNTVVETIGPNDQDSNKLVTYGIYYEKQPVFEPDTVTRIDTLF